MQELQLPLNLELEDQFARDVATELGVYPHKSDHAELPTFLFYVGDVFHFSIENEVIHIIWSGFNHSKEIIASLELSDPDTSPKLAAHKINYRLGNDPHER
jgi:hypothetical protein